MTETSEKPKLNPYLKLTLDIGPLLLFFVANSRFGIFAGTAVFDEPPCDRPADAA